MLHRFTPLLWLVCLGLVSAAHAAVQWRPAIGGYQVGNVYPTGKTYMYTNAESAGAARCIPRPGSALTGRYKLNEPLGSPHPSYIADCELRTTPPGVVPPQYAFPGSNNGYNLGYTYACKNRGQLDTRTWTCAVPDSRPPQPNSCGTGTGANEHGNPVDFSTGQKLQRETDYRGANGLNFTRQYQSNPSFDGFAPHWHHNFDKRMFSNLFRPMDVHFEAVYVLNEDGTWGNGALTAAGTAGPASFSSFPFRERGSGVEEAWLTREDGSVLYFSSTDSAKNWTGDADVNFKLTTLAPDATYPKGRYQLESPAHDKEIYDGSNGALLEIRYRDGRVHTLSYAMVNDKPNTLLQVADNFGRTLKFTWGRDHLLAKLTDPDGQELIYGYDRNNLLTSVTYPDGLSRLYHYDESANATPTGRSNVDGFLTGISDEVQSGRLIRRSTYRYNAKGLPVSTELAGGAEKYQFDYEAGSVTDPLGTTRRYTFQQQDGVKRMSSVSQPAGAGCDAATTQQSYDANGNIASSTNYNGVLTRYSYYPGNLLKSKVEAAGTAQQRTTSIEWHPVFRLPVKVAEPQLLTLYEYDGNGNLITLSEQATLDTTGAQGLTPVVSGTVRKSMATYNAVGQVLTETEFMDGVELTTRYQYHPQDGNLESITSPKGLITRYSHYTAHGDAGRIETPSGQITDMTYYPRRWLKSTTQLGDTDNLITDYDYDSRGRILREASSDGGLRIYNYDDAGRLINIADHIDNSIDFNLDAKGNRLLEQVRDSKGNLINQTRRTVDPLGRLLHADTGQNGPAQDVPTTTTLVSSDNPVRAGYPVRIMVNVGGALPGNALPGNALPSGEVVFLLGNQRLAVQFLHNGQATLEINHLPLGNHTLSAFYSGDNKNQPSTSTAILQVVQAGTASNLSLTCPPLSTVEGSLTCTASMRAEGDHTERLQGQAVKLREGNTILATGVLQVADGVATTELSMSGLAIGEHQFQVAYAGDAILLPTQSVPVPHTVQPHAPQITRITFSGPVDVGAIYQVALPGLANGTGGYASYTVAASDASLTDVARQFATRLQAVTRYQVQADGPSLTITGPDRVPFQVQASMLNNPTLSEGEFFQEALAPRPGTSARVKIDLGIVPWANGGSGLYSFDITLNRFAQNREFVEQRSASYGSTSRPANTRFVLDELCRGFARDYPGMQCYGIGDTSDRIRYIDMPVGQTGWEASGMFHDGFGDLWLTTSVRPAESTVLTPQPQIISVRPFGRASSGVVYSVTAGSETWRYTSNSGDTEAVILNGLAAAASSSQQYVPTVVTGRYGILNLQIASKTPVLPFTYSLATSNYHVAIEATLVQAAR